MKLQTQHNLAADSIILGVGAHPDDLDAIAGGTIAKMADQGATIYYLILTDGCRGSDNPDISIEQLVAARQQEQREAARQLGVREVFFLGQKDCELENTLALRKAIVSYIRRLKPDVVVTFDPTMLYFADMQLINHPDHRACGQAVLDAVFPLARDELSFPELNSDEVRPHKVKTLLLTNYEKQQYIIDVSDTMERKVQAMAAHTSQMPGMHDDIQRFRRQAAALGDKADCEYAEGFVRLDIQG